MFFDLLFLSFICIVLAISTITVKFSDSRGNSFPGTTGVLFYSTILYCRVSSIFHCNLNEKLDDRSKSKWAQMGQAHLTIVYTPDILFLGRATNNPKSIQKTGNH